MKKQVIANQSLKKEREEFYGCVSYAGPRRTPGRDTSSSRSCKERPCVGAEAACVGMRDAETAKDVGLGCVVVFLIQLKL